MPIYGHDLQQDRLSESSFTCLIPSANIKAR